MLIIDVGHGGSDPGACSNGLKEKDITLKLARSLEQIAEATGILTVMTRRLDETVTLQRRTDIANEVVRLERAEPQVEGWPAVLLSVHVNAGGGQGFEIFKQSSDDSGYAEKIADIQNKLGILRNRGVKTRRGSRGDYYHILREANCLAYILEVGFIDSRQDMKAALSPGNLRLLSAIPVLAYLQTFKKKSW